MEREKLHRYRNDSGATSLLFNVEDNKGEKNREKILNFSITRATSIRLFLNLFLDLFLFRKKLLSFEIFEVIRSRMLKYLQEDHLQCDIFQMIFTRLKYR